MSTPTLTPTTYRPFFPKTEAFAVLATAVAAGLAWWVGGVQAAPQIAQATCAAGPQVTSAHVENAALRVQEAAVRARYTAMNGSSYAMAKVGLAEGSPEHALALASAASLDASRQDLARACAEAAR